MSNQSPEDKDMNKLPAGNSLIKNLFFILGFILVFLNYNKPKISIDYTNEILRRKFNIKQDGKRKEILKDLKTDGIIKEIKYNDFILNQTRGIGIE